MRTTSCTLSVWFPIKVQARVCEWERARVLCDDGGWVYRTCSWFGVAFFGKFLCVTMNSSTIPSKTAPVQRRNLNSLPQHLSYYARYIHIRSTCDCEVYRVFRRRRRESPRSLNRKSCSFVRFQNSMICPTNYHHEKQRASE